MITVPGFEFIRQLSAGGFGAVYLAQRGTDGKHVAIKLLHLPNDENVRRFYREAKLLHEQIGNPHVVQLLGSDFQRSPPYIVMEYCSGGSLRNWVGKSFDWLEVVLALSHAASGLAKIHQAGGFHRDIKPDNLLLTQNEEGSRVVKVGDFGLARVPHTTTGVMTRNAAGTDGYIAPELSRGFQYDKPCDVYSLGVTGIELLTGSRGPSLLFKRTDIPSQLRDILLAMIRPQASLRPSVTVCQQVLAALGQEEHDKRARADEDKGREQEEQEVQAQAQARPAQRQVPRAGAAAAGAGLGLGGLALLVGGIALATMNPRDGDGRWRGRDGRFRSGPWS